MTELLDPRLGGRIRRALLALVALIAVACGHTSQSGHQVVTGVDIRGDTTGAEAELRRGIATRKDASYDPETLSKDLARIQRFYQARGYYEATTRAARVLTDDEDKVAVEIVVDPGAPVRVTRIDLSGWRCCYGTIDNSIMLRAEVSGVTHTSRLVRRFHEVVNAHGERICASDSGGSLSFRDIEQGARRLAAGLTRALWGSTRIALLAPASPAWVQGYWGVTLSGNLIVPLVEIHPAAEHARALAAARVDALLVSAELRGRADEALAQLGRTHPALVPPRVLELEALLASVVAHTDLLPEVDGAAPAVLFFTSGTTGEPKGAVVTHDQLAALAEMVATAWSVAPSDRLVHSLPLHHTHGLSVAFLVCFLSGASQYFLRRFVSEPVWQAFDGSTMFMGVPTMHKRLLDAFDEQPAEVQVAWREAARGLRLITSGSAALPESVALRWQALVDQIPLERFGMTEVGVALSNPLHGERRVGSCGQVLPGMQVRIVDETGRDVAPGEPGEIWIRGPSVFAGYDADVRATDAMYCDGWLKSGDTATWLEGGYVKILGRTSVDIIKSGGYKLSALEIEEALRRHPTVDEVAVVGMPDADWGETVVAAVVAKGPIDTEGLREFLKQELAPYKVPRRFVQVEELPKNALGKVTKHTLRTRL